MARKLTPEELDILRLYAAAEEKVVGHIARQLEKGLDAPDWAQVKQLELHETKRWIQGAPNPTARAQKKYTSLLDNTYRRTGSSALVRGKGDTQRQVLARIAHNTPLNLPNFQAVAMRTAEDVYRDVVRVGSAMTALGVESKKIAVRDAISDFKSRGVTAFMDKKGRRWNIKTYTEMAVTTGTRNAQRAGHLDRFAENGVDLVKVSTRPSSRRSGGKTCDRCKKWEGKILSITGATEGYPTLKEAESAGLHHPRCGHTVSAYFAPKPKVEPKVEPKVKLPKKTPAKAPAKAPKAASKSPSPTPTPTPSPTTYSDIRSALGMNAKLTKDELKAMRATLADMGVKVPAKAANSVRALRGALMDFELDPANKSLYQKLMSASPAPPKPVAKVPQIVNAEAPKPSELKRLKGPAETFTDNDTAIDWADKALPTARGAGREALKSYTGKSYKLWNRSLRQGFDPSSPIGKKTLALDGAFGPSPARFVVHRTTDATEFVVDNMVGFTDPASLVGTVQKQRGYMSTSIGTPRRTQSPVQMHITVNEGDKVLWARPDSFYKDEREVLLPRDTELFIHKVEQNNGTLEVYAEVLRRDG